MEIHLNEEFGINIYQTILKYELRQNLEIGSWDGTGSTRCFVEAMKQLEGDLFLGCLEILPERIEILKNLYEDLEFVHPINNSSINYNELLHKNFDEIWNSVYNKIPKKLYDYELVKSWYDRDVELLKSIEDVKNTEMVVISSQYCSQLTCSMVKDGKLHYLDMNHLNINGSKHIANFIVVNSKAFTKGDKSEDNVVSK